MTLYEEKNRLLNKIFTTHKYSYLTKCFLFKLFTLS